MRVGTASYYKTTLQEAIAAFTQINHMQVNHLVGGDHGLEASDEKVAHEGGFQGIFISGPLNELLNTRLVPLLRYRIEYGFPWDGAELFYNDNQGRAFADPCPQLSDKYYEKHEPRDLAPIVAADALTLTPNGTLTSFPLLAAQFALRHLVRCTEFCLVCHNKVSEDYEALKPYVCSSPLCLYQYMSLGLGPSIEYEIISQPSVVDLLVSFCYAAAKGNTLHEFPDGMNLTVPGPGTKTHKTSYHRFKNEMRFDDPSARPLLKVGDWLAITVAGFEQDVWHCRVIETNYFPTVKLGWPVSIRPGASDSGMQQMPAILPPTPPQFGMGPTTRPVLPGSQEIIEVSFKLYDTNFDDLQSADKHKSLASLMDTLPPVEIMRDWLKRNTKVGQEASLKRFDRISPSALGMLRWIIASNRSCIIPVEGDDAGGEPFVWGIGDMKQFRFASGAPDKTQRFVNEVRAARERLKLTYPSIFAFHGSPLHNWHSIIRQGLNFDKTTNGRAFGNGCYHSLDMNTSFGYSQGRMYGTNRDALTWPHSSLLLSCALSLNEIVNAPNEFVSKNPHLVVAQLDWIQTRYLFVKTGSQNLGADPLPKPIPKNDAHTKIPVPTPCFPQDPRYTPVGQFGKRLVIPASASTTGIKVSALTQNKPDAKGGPFPGVSATLSRQLGFNDADGDLYMTDPGANDESDSVVTENDDLLFLISDDESDTESETPVQVSPPPRQKVQAKPHRPDAFVPGELDTSKITFMPPPSYASPMATRRLNSDIQSLIKLQETEPLEELGFYINPDHVENVYQWIVELHSFPEHLPLVKDMRSKSPMVKSIVLEIRFGPQYPMSPPFVRVVSPRFLGFNQGGGGHVTLGGALCMELLTNNGWSAVSTVESVLMQVRLAMTEETPAARLERGPVRQYGMAEAKEAFMRACRVHNWTVPDDLKHIQ